MGQKLSFLIAAFLFFATAHTASALVLEKPELASCTCKTASSAKHYLKVDENWWGDVKVFSCAYFCQAPGSNEPELVTGTHRVWYLGAEDGDEIVCDGTVYVERYSTVKNWFYWDYDHSEPFKPLKSKSPEIQAWGQEHCLSK